MNAENESYINVEMPSTHKAKETACLFEPIVKVDNKGDILLLVNCSSSMSKNVKCIHHREKGKSEGDPTTADLTTPRQKATAELKSRCCRISL